KIPAALNKDYQVIFAVPTEIDDVEESAARLASILELDIDELRTALSKPNDQYEELISRANDSQLAKIRESAIKG
ncbi:hypothetical protein GW950_00005, partial [Candidatus Wolfebacteria bacterium]|nr:hypothetical protein [Candidatus Wolfebacteria bacterium]